MVFNVGDQVQTSDSGKVFFDKSRSFVAGPLNRFRLFRTKGHFEMIGVRFHLGTFPLLSNPLKELRNRAVRLDAIWEEKTLRSDIRSLELQLTQLSETRHQIACVEPFLMKVLRQWKEPEDLLTRAISLIEKSSGRISIRALASALGTSNRQLERRFSHRLGLTPKALCRIIRFRQVKVLLESAHTATGGALACAAGYYDQTHFIHEFRSFTGQTPGCYKKAFPLGSFICSY